MFREYWKSFDNLYSILLPSVGPVQTSRVAFIRPSFDTTRAIFTKDKVPLKVYFSPGLIRWSVFFTRFNTLVYWSPRSSWDNVMSPNYERIIGTLQKHKNHWVSIHTSSSNSQNGSAKSQHCSNWSPKSCLTIIMSDIIMFRRIV